MFPNGTGGNSFQTLSQQYVNITNWLGYWNAVSQEEINIHVTVLPDYHFKNSHLNTESKIYTRTLLKLLGHHHSIFKNYFYSLQTF